MTDSKQEEIFQDWLSKHKGIFFKVIHAYASQQQDQEDLFQEIAVNVWRSVPNFRNNCAVSTWIYRIALNHALKWSVKNKEQKANSQDEELIRVLKPQEEPPSERLVWLYEQIRNLDEVDRSLCLLLFDGFKYKEMAEVLGLSESNVGVKINRIKKHLTEQSKKM